ncbi:winged helix-turn-helix domain-containing protein [Bacteroides sp.]|uniref:winged helix-turn-helix domain-containing protein n=1 Tax=Bacteroides sp. TaxID=29523 RepID=UPI0026129390|nr:winged helix-turn-helix domain-containing protein [Bacteroides sp.]MDD3036745.1 winged helix-turn-helix domain-containing protein [Bacteroides sp.]
MMEKTKIGFNAGKVWRILNEKGELSMFNLCHELGLTFEDVAIAIGWLARENKIFLRKKEGMLFASIENVEFSFG